MANEQPSQPEQVPPSKLSPELLEWARQQINEEEIAAGIREIRATGGLQLEDFIEELEKEATRRD